MRRCFALVCVFFQGLCSLSHLLEQILNPIRFANLVIYVNARAHDAAAPPSAAAALG